MTPVPRRVAVGRGRQVTHRPCGAGLGTHSLTRGGAGRLSPAGAGSPAGPGAAHAAPASPAAPCRPGRNASVLAASAPPCRERGLRLRWRWVKPGEAPGPPALPLGRVSGSGLRGSLARGTGPGRVRQEGVLGSHGKHSAGTADTQQEVWKVGGDKGPPALNQGSRAPCPQPAANPQAGGVTFWSSPVQ